MPEKKRYGVFFCILISLLILSSCTDVTPSVSLIAKSISKAKVENNQIIFETNFLPRDRDLSISDYNGSIYDLTLVKAEGSIKILSDKHQGIPRSQTTSNQNSDLETTIIHSTVSSSGEFTKKMNLGTSVHYFDNLNKLKISSDGSIYELVSTPRQLRKYTSSGNIDISFGTNGSVVIDPQIECNTQDLLIGCSFDFQSNGKIIVSGTMRLQHSDFVVTRLNQSGSTDTTFGINGKSSIDISGFDDISTNLEVGSDDNIYIDGFVAVPGISHFAVVRLLPSGSIDTSYGINGKVIETKTIQKKSIY